jgi:hypothetical protein
MMSDLIHGMSMGVIQEEFREIIADHGHQVNIHMIDTPVPSTIDGKEFVYDSFDFSPQSQALIERVVAENLFHKLGDYSQIFNLIAETKARESVVEPLAAFIPPAPQQKQGWFSGLTARFIPARGTPTTVHAP